MGKLLTGEALHARAERLGVVIYADGPHDSGPQGMFRARATEAEIQRRVIEAENHLRTNRLWIVALVSAGASAVSALAAWCAIFLRSNP